jgi:hypothetical protein
MFARYLEGQNFALEYRRAGEPLDRLPALATARVCLQVELILVWTLPTTLAAKYRTTPLPILMVGIGYPIERGLVASLTQPGDNITGRSFTARPEPRDSGATVARRVLGIIEAGMCCLRGGCTAGRGRP